MANERIGIDIVAKVDGLKAELAKLAPGMDKEAKAMVAALERELKRAEAATKKAAETSGAHTKATIRAWADADREAAKATGFSVFADKADTSGTAAAKAAKALGPLGGVLSRISPEAGAAASSVAGLTSAVEGFVGAGAGIATVGAAAFALAGVLAPIGGYLYVMHREAAEADARTAFLAEHTDDLSAALGTLETALTDAAIATGRLSGEQAAYVKNQDAATKAIEDFRRAQEDERATAQAAAVDAQVMLQKLEVLPGFLSTAIDYYGGYSSSLKEATWTLTELDKQEDAHQTVVSDTKAATDEATKATLASRQAKEASAAAAKKAAEAEREQTKAAEEAARAADVAAKAAASWAHELAVLREGADLAELNDRIIEIAQAERDGAVDAAGAADLKAAAHARYAESVAEGEAKVRAEQEKSAREEEARLKDIERARKESEAALQAQWDHAADAAAPYLEILDSIASALLEQHTDALADVTDQIETIDELLADLSDTSVNAADLSGKALVDAYKAGEVAVEDLSDAQKAALEKDLERQQASLEKTAAMERAAADEAFYLQQASSIAATIIAGLQGAVAAFQLGPIAGAVAAAGIAALTATNIALIASTKPEYRHAGGMYPDEAGVIGLPGESILNRPATNAAGGPQGVAAMNAGHSTGGGVTVVRIGRHEAREIARTDIRSNGIIPQTVRSIARRSGKGVGLSGRGVIA